MQAQWGIEILLPLTVASALAPEDPINFLRPWFKLHLDPASQV